MKLLLKNHFYSNNKENIPYMKNDSTHIASMSVSKATQTSPDGRPALKTIGDVLLPITDPLLSAITTETIPVNAPGDGDCTLATQSIGTRNSNTFGQQRNKSCPPASININELDASSMLKMYKENESKYASENESTGRARVSSYENNYNQAKDETNMQLKDWAGQYVPNETRSSFVVNQRSKVLPKPLGYLYFEYLLCQIE